MDMSKWVDKKVFIRLQNGFIKFGDVVRAGHNFVVLEYLHKDKTVVIYDYEIDSIESYREVGDNG